MIAVMYMREKFLGQRLNRKRKGNNIASVPLVRKETRVSQSRFYEILPGVNKTVINIYESRTVI